jgi:hypothetical protein
MYLLMYLVIPTRYSRWNLHEKCDNYTCVNHCYLYLDVEEGIKAVWRKLQDKELHSLTPFSDVTRMHAHIARSWKTIFGRSYTTTHGRDKKCTNNSKRNS